MSYGHSQATVTIMTPHGPLTALALVAWVRRGAACRGAEAVGDAAMSVADDLAGDVPEASDDEWAHELMHRVAAAVARVREGGE